jgi:hypothetical protein
MPLVPLSSRRKQLTNFEVWCFITFSGLPYGYLTPAGAAAALGSTDRILAAAAAAASAGGTTYFTTAATPGDYQSQSAVAGSGLSILQPLTRAGASTINGGGIGVSAAGMAPPMSPPATMQPQRADHQQYVVQRMIQGQTAAGQCQSLAATGSSGPIATSRGLLALQDYAGGDFGRFRTRLGGDLAV